MYVKSRLIWVTTANLGYGMVHQIYNEPHLHVVRFLGELAELVMKKQTTLADKGLSEDERNNQLQELTVGNPPARLEDLGLVICWRGRRTCNIGLNEQFGLVNL